MSSGSEVVGLAVLVARRETRHGLLRVRGLHLNETGDRRIDPISIEYNGVLADRSVGNASVIRRSLTWLAENEDGWDELTLGGLNPETAEIWEKAAVDSGLGIRVQAQSRCDCIDLEAMRRRGVVTRRPLSLRTCRVWVSQLMGVLVANIRTCGRSQLYAAVLALATPAGRYSPRSALDERSTRKRDSGIASKRPANLPSAP